MGQSLREAIDRFLLESGFSADTQASYGRYLRLLRTWLEEQRLSPKKMQPGDFLRFLEDRNWSNATRRLCWQAVKGFLAWCYGAGHQALQLKIRKVDSAPQRTLSPGEIQRLFTSIDVESRTGQRDLPLIMVTLDAGLRASEICRLEVGRLDLECLKLSVLAKGGKWRACVYSELTRACLATWLEIRKGIARPEVDAVFVSVGGSRPGTSLTRDGLRAVFKAMGSRAGIRGLTPHVMRRSFATVATARGAPSRLVQVAGGWSSIDMVERYTRALRPEDFRGYFPTDLVSDEALTR